MGDIFYSFFILQYKYKYLKVVLQFSPGLIILQLLHCDINIYFMMRR